MSFPFSKLSPAAAVSAAEQMLENVKHLENLPSEERIFELVTNIHKDKPVVIEALRKKRVGEYTQEINDHIDLFQKEYDIFVMPWILQSDVLHAKFGEKQSPQPRNLLHVKK